jgi:DNA-binding beta-propeller fold protein YncE
MNQLLSITIVLVLTCLAAGPGQAADPPQTTAPTPSAIGSITLQPVRVVYQQIEGTFLKGPRGVWVDNVRNEIYVADTANDLVAVYDAAGLPLFAFGYNQELKEPTKAILDANGRILVLNGIPRTVKVFNYRGEYLNDFPLVRKDSKDAPTAIATDKSGNIYVAISGESGGQVQVYGSNYQLLNEFGKKADGSSYVKSVHAITTDRGDGDIYLADATATPSIQVYSPNGKFLRGWGAHDAGPQNFSLPSGLAIDGDGRVIVVDSIRQAMMIFTKEGKFLGREGGLGDQPGAFMYPTDIDSNGNKNIYIVDRLGNRLQVLEERLVAAAKEDPNAARLTEALREQMRRQFNDFTRGAR